MKVKHCSVCDKDVPNLFKSKPPTCINCYQRKPIKSSTSVSNTKVDTKVTEGKKVAPRPRIKVISTKQAKINQAYTVLRKEYLKYHPNCEVRLHVCSGISVDIHHCASGSNKRKHYLDETTFKSTCRECHHVIHTDLSAEELYELGLKIRT